MLQTEVRNVGSKFRLNRPHLVCQYSLRIIWESTQTGINFKIASNPYRVRNMTSKAEIDFGTLKDIANFQDNLP